MTAKVPPPGIPTVDFYGDAAPWPTSALVHSEPLVERSRRHAWRIRPHRHHGLAQVFWLERGGGTGRFDTLRRDLSAPSVLVVPERCVHEFEWSRESDGFALSIASSLVQELRRQVDPQGLTFREPSVIAAGPDAGKVGALFQAVHDESGGDGPAPMREIMLDSLIRALTIWIARHTAPASRASEHASPASRHYERFTQLLDQHHRAQWTVARYADTLGITPSHLNAICHQVGHASALHLIHTRLLLAARRELTYTDKTIADVAGALGFSEPSYFTRFFKRKMTITPKEYRRRSGTLAG